MKLSTMEDKAPTEPSGNLFTSPQASRRISSTPSSLEKRCKSTESVLEEVEEKGTLIERVSELEKRLMKVSVLANIYVCVYLYVCTYVQTDVVHICMFFVKIGYMISDIKIYLHLLFYACMALCMCVYIDIYLFVFVWMGLDSCVSIYMITYHFIHVDISIYYLEIDIYQCYVCIHNPHTIGGGGSCMSGSIHLPSTCRYVCVYVYIYKYILNYMCMCDCVCMNAMYA